MEESWDNGVFTKNNSKKAQLQSEALKLVYQGTSFLDNNLALLSFATVTNFSVIDPRQKAQNTTSKCKETIGHNQYQTDADEDSKNSDVNSTSL